MSWTHGPTCSGTRCQSNPARPGTWLHRGLPRLHLLPCQISGEAQSTAAITGEGRGERLCSKLNPANTKPGCPLRPRSRRGKAGTGSPSRQPARRGVWGCLPRAARGCWLPPGRPPSAQPGSPPSLRTGEDFGNDGGVQPDRLPPLRALQDKAGAGPAALAGGRAVRPGAGEGLPAPRAICRPAGGRHLLPWRRLAVLQHR